MFYNFNHEKQTYVCLTQQKKMSNVEEADVWRRKPDE
jgi:hypothetical protein